MEYICKPAFAFMLSDLIWVPSSPLIFIPTCTTPQTYGYNDKQRVNAPSQQLKNFNAIHELISNANNS